MQQLGSADARTVLVLAPGTNGGAGSITPVARDIAKRVPHVQVWIVDRREQAFEDTSVFRTHDPRQAQDYYLGFHYNRVDGGDAKYVAGWGLKLQLTDLRAVIRRAHAGGRSSARTSPRCCRTIRRCRRSSSPRFAFRTRRSSDTPSTTARRRPR